MRLTINKINKAIKHLNLELVKGYGYFYFAVTDFNYGIYSQCSSVYVNKLNENTLEEWIAEAEKLDVRLIDKTPTKLIWNQPTFKKTDYNK